MENDEIENEDIYLDEDYTYYPRIELYEYGYNPLKEI